MIICRWKHRNVGISARWDDRHQSEVVLTCEIWGSHSAVPEDLTAEVWCYTAKWVFPKQWNVMSQKIWTFQFWHKLDFWLGISYPNRLLETCYSNVWTASVVLRRLLQYVTLSWLSKHWRLCNETPEAVDTSEMNEYSAPVPNIKEFRLIILGGPLWLVFCKLF